MRRVSDKAGLKEAIFLGLSSSGPAQTMSVSIAGLIAAVGGGAPAVVLLAFIPMLGIAIGYLRLNRWDPRAGATFNWVAQVFHPYLGFLSGWMILMYYTLGTTSLTLPAGTYTLALLAPSAVDNPFAVVAAGLAWNFVLTLLALRGLRPAARLETVSVVLQYAVIGALAFAGVVALLHGHTAVPFRWNAFSIESMGGSRGVSAGLLVACFMYSGWDAAIYINEESADRRENPGRAAVASVVLLALFYAFATLGLGFVLTPTELNIHAANALEVIAPQLLGRYAAPLTSSVVLLGTLATLQAAIICAARVGAAMAREKVLPALLTRNWSEGHSPRSAIITMSIANSIFLLLTLLTGSVAEALTNVVASLGLMSVVFYGLTAAAALWHARRSLASSWRSAISGGALPAVGVAGMIYVAIESIRTHALSKTALMYGGGAMFAGFACALVLHRVGNQPFFMSASRSRSTPWSDDRD